MKEKLIERIKVLQEALEKSLANHNSLIGRMAEARDQLSDLEKEESSVESE